MVFLCAKCSLIIMLDTKGKKHLTLLQESRSQMLPFYMSNYNSNLHLRAALH